MHEVTSSCEEIRAIALEQESLQQEMQTVREVRSNLFCLDFEKIAVTELVREVAKKALYQCRSQHDLDGCCQELQRAKEGCSAKDHEICDAHEAMQVKQSRGINLVGFDAEK